MPLTGKFRFRRALRGRVVLTVEEEVRRGWPFSRTNPIRKRWRDANLWDLTDPKIRDLISLRDGARLSTEQPAAPNGQARTDIAAARSDGMGWAYPASDGSGTRLSNGH